MSTVSGAHQISTTHTYTSYPQHFQIAETILKTTPSLESSSPLDTWNSLFIDASPSSTLLLSCFTQSRHVYTPTRLRQLRHDHQLSLPDAPSISLTTTETKTTNTLPVLPFSNHENALTADVLLNASESSLTFSDLRLHSSLVSSLNSAGFTRPSPIQLRTLPRARLGSDIIAHAKSGTGKTLAFALVIIDALLQQQNLKQQEQKPPQCLILTPTRELAVQVGSLFEKLCSRVFAVAVLVGGIDERKNIKTITENSPLVVIGTPGRVRALVNSSSLPLHAVNIFVLDEADRLLEQSFASDVQAVCQHLPDSRQTLAFSATFAPWLRRVLLNIMKTPAYITCDPTRNTPRGQDELKSHQESNIDSNISNNHHHNTNLIADQLSLTTTKTTPTIKNEIPTESVNKNDDDDEVSMMQKAVLLGVRQSKLDIRTYTSSSVYKKQTTARLALLTSILHSWSFNLCIIFVNHRNQVSLVESSLLAHNISNCRGINAGVKQAARAAIMTAVRSGKVDVLVATDLVARGIDLPTCDLVIHFSLPVDVATYLHRVGRAGRFGGQGRSLLLYGTRDDYIPVEHVEEKLGYTVEIAKDVPQSLEQSKSWMSGSRYENASSGDRKVGVKAEEKMKDVYEEDDGSSENIGVCKEKGNIGDANNDISNVVGENSNSVRSPEDLMEINNVDGTGKNKQNSGCDAYNIAEDFFNGANTKTIAHAEQFFEESALPQNKLDDKAQRKDSNDAELTSPQLLQPYLGGGGALDNSITEKLPIKRPNVDKSQNDDTVNSSMVDAVSKRRRIAVVQRDQEHNANPRLDDDGDDWDRLARKAEQKGFEEGYAYAYRLAFQIRQKLLRK